MNILMVPNFALFMLHEVLYVPGHGYGILVTHFKDHYSIDLNLVNALHGTIPFEIIFLRLLMNVLY